MCDDPSLLEMADPPVASNFYLKFQPGLIADGSTWVLRASKKVPDSVSGDGSGAPKKFKFLVSDSEKGGG